MQMEPLRSGGQRLRKMPPPAGWTETCGVKGKDVTGLTSPRRRDPRPVPSPALGIAGGAEGTLSPRRPLQAQRVPASLGPDPSHPLLCMSPWRRAHGSGS